MLRLPRLMLMMGDGNKLRYFLRDDFTGTLGVGAVNGTQAIRGPGTRRVRDSENHLTLAGDVLVVDGGTAAPDHSDPSIGLNTPSIVRAAGQVMLFELTQSGGAGRFAGGWYSANPPFTKGNLAQWENVFYSTNLTSINCTDKSGSHDISPLLRISGKSYQYAVVLKATGAYYFIRGDKLTNWTFLMMIPNQSATPLYPGIGGRDSAFTAKFLVAPQRPYLPVPLFYDTYTRSNGALGNSEAVGPDGQTAPVLPWTGTTWTIAINRAVNTPNLGVEQNSGALVVGTWYSITATQANHFFTGCAIGNTFLATATTALDANNKVKALTLSELFSTVNEGTPNIVARVKIHALTAGTQAGIGIRLDSASSPTEGIVFMFDGQGNIKGYEIVGGVWTQLYTAVKAFTADDELQIWANGYYIEGCVLFRHHTAAGAWVESSLTAISTNITNGDIVGAFSTDPTNTIEEIDCFPVGSYGEYAALDQYVPPADRQTVKYNPSVALSFDDAVESTYTMAYPYLQARGLKATAYIWTAKVNSDGNRLTDAQLRELQTAGWTIGNHTRDHNNMVGHTQADDETDILNGYNDLIGWGITSANAHHFAYPGGGVDANALLATAAQGCLTARNITPPAIFPLDPLVANPLNIMCHVMFGNLQSLHYAKNWVDRWRTNRELGFAFGHDLISGTPTLNTQWNITDWQNWIDFCIAEGIEFLSLEEAYNRWHG